MRVEVSIDFLVALSMVIQQHILDCLADSQRSDEDVDDVFEDMELPTMATVRTGVVILTMHRSQS